ncbi:MAG: hypothetical protein F4210_13725 [Holophagales bacterium]|nr:hypothetical protein [Holophagales bacterium]MYF96539.1 hypothetical protein [Holophagales bacterium]
MNVPQHEPAQREWVHRLLDWKLVEARRERFPAIRRTFPLTLLRKHEERAPYYSHYMSWRLSTWRDEALLERLEELLLCAEALPNWKQEKASLVGSRDYSEFWSLVWQLQMAEYLSSVGSEVAWGSQKAPSPDLSAVVDGQRCFVECYVPRKSFGLLNYIEDVVSRVDESICVSYDSCLPFRLAGSSNVTDFIDQVLKQCLDPNRLAEAKGEAEEQYPVVLFKDEHSSLYVYVEGETGNKYMPGIVPNRVGCPERYLEVVLREALEAKRHSNGLRDHRPNLLAVSFLLSKDFQLAEALRGLPAMAQVDPDIGATIDTLAVSTTGINERLSKGKLKIVLDSSAANVGLKRIATRAAETAA